jgi:hypothetical protein
MNAVTVAHNGGHMSASPRITRDDVIEYLMARTTVSSGSGAQFEAMRLGLLGTRGGGMTSYAESAARVDRQHRAALRLATISRCVSQLMALQSVSGMSGAGHLRQFAREAAIVEGQAVAEVLRSYHEWSLKSQERGLAQVFAWMRGRMPGLGKGEGTEDDLAQAFRENRRKRARTKALLLLADAESGLKTWVLEYDRKTCRRGR